MASSFIDAFKNRMLNLLSSRPDSAKLKHQEVSTAMKDPSYGRPDEQPIRKKSDKIHTVKGKSTVKIKSGLSPRKLEPLGIVNKFKGSSGRTKLAISIGTLIGMSWMIGSLSKTVGKIQPAASVSRVGLDVRASSYIPEKYTRGYDTIKESMTDFGSRVILSKTASKVLVSPKNSTRENFTTDVSALTRSNLAFQLHSNAINHTRY